MFKEKGHHHPHIAVDQINENENKSSKQVNYNFVVKIVKMILSSKTKIDLLQNNHFYHATIIETKPSFRNLFVFGVVLSSPKWRQGVTN